MLLPVLQSDGQVLAEVRGTVGLITLNRPAALNALSLAMIRDLTALLLHWQSRDEVHAVVVRGAAREGKAPAFCAGGDIRFFHQAALAGDPRLEDFFTEEYRLNHLIHHYPKPYIALMDGITMGGGMGISQGAACRVVTQHSKLAMPETNIGLFPDVGGGWFLSRCPGHVGEYLALTGQVLHAAEAITWGLADVFVPSQALPAWLESLCDQPFEGRAQCIASARARAEDPGPTHWTAHREAIDRHFSHPSVAQILASLEQDGTVFASETAQVLRKRSPLMLCVTLEQLRRARGLPLADDLRMERDLVRNAFHLRTPQRSETTEGIRALAVDKDHQPRWAPARVEEVDAAEVQRFFDSPWPAHAHPLRDLQD